MSDTPSAWHEKLVAGFRRTSERLGDNLQSLFTKEKLDRETLDEIEAANAMKAPNAVDAGTRTAG